MTATAARPAAAAPGAPRHVVGPIGRLGGWTADHVRAVSVSWITLPPPDADGVAPIDMLGFIVAPPVAVAAGDPLGAPEPLAPGAAVAIGGA